MKLNEIIFNISENNQAAVNIEKMHPYFKSLYIFFKAKFNSEPVLMVTAVFNACSYAKIVSSENLEESIYSYLENDFDVFSEDEVRKEVETINFNSRFLKDLINF